MKTWLKKIHSVWCQASEPERLRRNLLVLVAVILLVVVVGRLAWSSYNSLHAEIKNRIEINTLKYENQQRLLAQGEDFKSFKEDMNSFQQSSLQKKFIQGETPALAEVKFQNVINSSAKETNLTILSMRMLPRKKEGRLSRLNMSINCRAEITAITDFLERLKHAETFIDFRKLEIKIVNRREERYYNFNAEMTAFSLES
jgi:Tfp pilus assembly protein PilO